MRQTEIFPILEDQKLIEDYIAYQKALNSWKKTKLVSQKTIIRANEALKDAKCSNNSEIEKRGFINKLHGVIEQCEDELSKSQMHIDSCKEIIDAYGTYFSCKDEF